MTDRQTYGWRDRLKPYSAHRPILIESNRIYTDFQTLIAPNYANDSDSRNGSISCKYLSIMHSFLVTSANITRVRRFAWNIRCLMFRYLGAKIPMSNTDSDVYRCEVSFIFCTMYLCFVLFVIDVTAVKYTINIPCLFICMHIHHDSKKGCYPNYGRNFVNSWSICKILSLLQRTLNFQQNLIGLLTYGPAKNI